jgi:hypothetical protein
MNLKDPAVNIAYVGAQAANLIDRAGPIGSHDE